jgi:aerobic carbon-monoxide dehydrogenase small subunit
MTRISVNVDGVRYDDDVEPRTLLVHHLRERLGKVGTVVGCDTSNCGACTVLISDPDGRLVGVKSCAVLAVQADGRDITTIEGLAGPDNALHPVQQAFHDRHALQCGFCTPGMIMAAVDLLQDNPDPTDTEIREGLEGNLCRCTGYQNIVRAVRDAAGALRASGDSAEPAEPITDAGAAGGAAAAGTPDAGRPPEQVPDEVAPQPVP